MIKLTTARARARHHDSRAERECSSAHAELASWSEVSTCALSRVECAAGVANWRTGRGTPAAWKSDYARLSAPGVSL